MVYSIFQLKIITISTIFKTNLKVSDCMCLQINKLQKLYTLDFHEQNSFSEDGF